MELLKAAILGIVQGLTEFLPVSSSGHLELFKYFMNDDALGEESLMMTIVLHFATALSTIVVFRKTIIQLIVGLFQFKWNKETQFITFIVISMIPAALVGYFFEEQLEAFFNQRIPFVAFMLMLTGMLLFIADKAKYTNKPVTGINAFIVGVAQAIAMLPGISRSGATISTSVLLGIDREEAAKFSFIMVLPLIIGKIGLDFMDGSFNSDKLNFPELGIGFFAAFLTGVFSCNLMIKVVKRSQLKYFAFYCLGIALIALILFYTI